MAIGLQNTDNIVAPGGNYPYGRARDNDGSGNGTPANTKTLGDFHQYFARMMAFAGITPNNLPDNAADGFQYFEALLRSVGKLQGSDLNTQVFAGVFYVNSTNANIPTGMSADRNKLTVSVDSSDNDNVYQHIVDLNNGASWSRRSDNAGATWDTWTLIEMAKKVIDIGNWDMTAGAGTINIPHGVTNLYQKKHFVSVSIRADSDAGILAEQVTELSKAGYFLSCPADLRTHIILLRNTAGEYDSTNYNLTPFPRGYIYLQWVP